MVFGEQPGVGRAPVVVARSGRRDGNEIEITMDYSRFENQTATQQRLEREVSRGITSKAEYRMKVYGETKEVAEQKIAEIEESNPSVEDLLGTKEE